MKFILTPLIILCVNLVGCSKEDETCFKCKTVTTNNVGYYDEFTITRCDWSQQRANNYEQEATFNSGGVTQETDCVKQ